MIDTLSYFLYLLNKETPKGDGNIIFFHFKTPFINKEPPKGDENFFADILKCCESES